MTAKRTPYLSALLFLGAAISGCPSTQAHPEDAGTCTDGGTAANCGGSSEHAALGTEDTKLAESSSHDAGDPQGTEATETADSGPAQACGTTAPAIKKADLLFVIDNSGSMREEQAALQAELPRLIGALTSGKRSANDPNPFPPVEDLHVAVVSSDMGLLGVTGISGCAGFGDDGVMMSPVAQGCEGAPKNQRYLRYRAGGDVTPAQFAANFACLANLGTEGCGFEQQLEASLKALWPAAEVDPATGEAITPFHTDFLADAEGNGDVGHGDAENNGFLRRDSDTVLGIVVVTDEEDCSAHDTRHFTPMSYLEPTDPLYTQDLNLRCFHNKQNLYKVERYVDGWKAMHPGNEQLVVFAAIAGVPPDLVDGPARAGIDFANAGERDAYYATLLSDPRMQETIDPTRPAGNGGLTPSCNTVTGLAYPPRRLVEIAKRMGENGLVQSICQSDFGPALDAFVDKLSARLGDPCGVQ